MTIQIDTKETIIDETIIEETIIEETIIEETITEKIISFLDPNIIKYFNYKTSFTVCCMIVLPIVIFIVFLIVVIALTWFPEKFRM